MSKRKRPPIKCPQCGKDKNLSIHASIKYASVRIPVTKGKLTPAYELLREEPISSDEVFLRFSDTKGGTRIALHKDDITFLVHCPYCKKMLDLSKGILVCSDVE